MGRVRPQATLAAPRAEGELERLRRRNAELEVLYDTIRDLTSTLSVQEVLERLLERTLRHLASEIGSILLLGRDERLRIAVARGLPDRVVRRTSLALGESISGYVAETQTPLLVRNVERDPRFRRRNHERYYTRSLISCPLVLKEKAVGVINVNNKRSREAFQASDLRLLEAIAGHAAVALGNARAYEETLERAQRDALTGLANHGHFFAVLEREIERAMRYGRDLALVMFDIDRFKAYNDRHGHRAGDAALMRVAEVLASRSRAHDLVARYGGEEFAVILPEGDARGGRAFAEKIRRAVEALGFGESGDERLTLSAGVAVLPACGASAEELVEAADAELYRAKASGRNRVCAPGSADARPAAASAPSA